MFEINTQIDIHSPIETVWSCLMDTEKYPLWNKFIRKINGVFSVGNPLTIEIVLPPKEVMKFSPTCTKVNKNSELRWVGNIGFDWIFRGEHCFILEQIDNNKTRFIHSEKFSGLLCWVFKKLKADPTKQGFEIMNKNLADYLNSDRNND